MSQPQATPGARLHHIRTKAGEQYISYFARDHGLSSGYVSLLETDRRVPALATIAKHAHAYGLTPLEMAALWLEDEAWVAAQQSDPT